MTDADVLTFALAGCNAAEVAAYAGIPESVADDLLHVARTRYADGGSVGQRRYFARLYAQWSRQRAAAA